MITFELLIYSINFDKYLLSSYDKLCTIVGPGDKAADKQLKMLLSLWVHWSNIRQNISEKHNKNKTKNDISRSNNFNQIGTEMMMTGEGRTTSGKMTHGCASKPALQNLKKGGGGGGRGKYDFQYLPIFMVKILRHANFKLLMWSHWTWFWEQMHTVALVS